MDRIGAGLHGCRDDLVGAQIALGGRSRPDQHSLVGHANMQRPGIGFRIDGDAADAHPLGGAHDTAGNLAAIGNQERFDHGRSDIPLAGGRRYCTAATRTKLMIIRRYHEPSLASETMCQPASWPG